MVINANGKMLLNLKKCFSLLIVFYPILNRYKSPFPIITLSEFLMVIFWIISLMERIRKRTGYLIAVELLPFCIYLVLQGIFAAARYEKIIAENAVGTTVRLLFLYGSLLFLSRTYFRLKYGVRYIKVTATILAIYGILQTIFARIGIYLTTYIPFLPVYADKTANSDVLILERATYGIVYRCFSFLNEPAHLCTYLLLALGLELFLKDNDRQHKLRLILYISCCFISMSSTGIIVVIITLIIFFFSKKGFTKEKIASFLLTGILFAFIGSVLLNTLDIWDVFMQKTFGGKNISLKGLLSSSRFNGIENVFSENSTGREIVFGKGLIDARSYLPGWPRVYYCLGIAGLLLILMMLIHLYRSGTFLQKKLNIIYIILNIGTEVLFGNFAVIYMPFLLAEKVNASTSILDTNSIPNKRIQKTD